jgi:hypothetical protein
MSQQLDQRQTQTIQDTDSSSQSPVPKVSSQVFTKGLRRSSRLAAISFGPEAPHCSLGTFLGLSMIYRWGYLQTCLGEVHNFGLLRVK